MSKHIPVLLQEMTDALDVRAGGVFVDATYGGGGYTQSIFEASDKAEVIGIDRDPDAQKRAERHTGEKRFTFVRARFGDMEDAVRPLAPEGVDGIVMDIGVSSFQIDIPERGFSFMSDGPLDMRMDPENGQSAADIVNTMEEGELADLFYIYGEERHSRRIARAIVAQRPFETTAQLAAAISKSVPPSRDKAHPATRCFQALRIVVNDELGELERGLEAAQKLLKVGGRLVVVTFHSLEDRIVKQFFATQSGRLPNTSRYLPDAANENAPTMKLIKSKPITPGDDELRANPRARSAKLRAAIKIGDAA